MSKAQRSSRPRAGWNDIKKEAPGGRGNFAQDGPLVFTLEMNIHKAGGEEHGDGADPGA